MIYSENSPTFPKEYGMNATIPALISSEAISTSAKNLSATDKRASYGQAWNQSITVAVMMAGNLVERDLKPSPTGEKQRAMCKFLLTLV